MSKGSEALDRLINEVEKDSRTVSFLFHDIESWEEDKELVLKELKALEIIKIKKVNVWSLYTSFRTKELWAYNNGTIAREYKLTQEEYELLKEVLL